MAIIRHHQYKYYDTITQDWKEYRSNGDLWQDITYGSVYYVYKCVHCGQLIRSTAVELTERDNRYGSEYTICKSDSAPVIKVPWYKAAPRTINCLIPG